MTSDRHREFDCPECGRHIISIVPSGFEPLCSVCVNIPGWYKIEEVRSVVDPDHTGEDQPTDVPLWEPEKNPRPGEESA